MSTHHTPGPWLFIPEDATAASLVESDGTSILVMYALENSTGATRFAANTQLIASAPTLLAALRELQANPNDPRAHRTALDAIAQATHQ